MPCCKAPRRRRAWPRCRWCRRAARARRWRRCSATAAPSGPASSPSETSSSTTERPEFPSPCQEPTMSRRFVDLSIFLENDVLSDPPPLAPKITYQKHADTLPEFMHLLPGTKAEDYPDG